MMNYTDQYYYIHELDNTIEELSRIKNLQKKKNVILVRADRQTMGIGRGSNKWFSPNGGLWFSLGIYLSELYPSLSLYIGYTVHRVLCKLYPSLISDLRIKWTNDIMYKDEKLAGILIRHCAQEGFYNIGIGINTNIHINNKEEHLSATSLMSLFGFPVSNDAILHTLITHICNEIVLLNTPEKYVSYCNNHLYGMGRTAEASIGDSKITGIVRSINEDGSLILEQSGNHFERIYTGSLRVLFT